MYAAGSVRAPDSNVEFTAFVAGTGEHSMNKEGSDVSRILSAEGAEEEGAMIFDKDNAPDSDSADSTSAVVSLLPGENMKSQSTCDGEKSEDEALMKSQDSSAIDVDTSSNRIIPMDFVPL